jgi:hypothetical protein
VRISRQFVDLLQVIAWPIVLIVALAMFWRPLSRFVENLGAQGRGVKLSILEFGLELSPLPQIQPGWQIGEGDIRRLTSELLIDSMSMPLFEQLSAATDAEYAVIDLGTGDQWLSSRLFAFAVLLERMTGVRCFVFTETKSDVVGRFVGIASPDEIRWALARCYPWLESAFAFQYAYICGSNMDPIPDLSKPISQWPVKDRGFRLNLSPTGGLEPTDARNLVQWYVRMIQADSLPLNANEKEWISGKDERGEIKCERASPLNAGWLYHNLNQAMVRNTSLIDSPTMTRSERIENILRLEGKFAALLGHDGQFRYLIDRGTLIDTAVPSIVESG